MDPLMIARWQFGITTVYHFLLVPLTIGLGPLILWMQWRWLRTGDVRWYRMVKFWGKLYLINFIMGVATGIVQEFQFGLAWSQYSRFVGDVFGAPLAMEALLAFFAESTFLGLWIFGWGRLPKPAHFLSLLFAILGSVISAYFILVANSWMQHPVGVQLVHGHPVMIDVFAVLTNNTAILTFAHTLAGSFAVGGSFLLGISWYQLWQRRRDGIDTVDADGRVVVGEAQDIAGRDRLDHKVWITALRAGAGVAVVAFALVAISGDAQGKLMFVQQPMKMAAAEAACHSGTDFSVLTIGDPGSTDCSQLHDVIVIPGVLSFLAKGDFSTPVKGVEQLLGEYKAKYGTNYPVDPRLGIYSGKPIDYVPIMPVTYWGFRAMIGFGGMAAFASLVALWITRKGTVPHSKRLMNLAVLGIMAPFAANSAGWIFTEMGRQPFVVAPNPTPGGVDGVYLFTVQGISPTLTPFELITSLVLLTSVYAALMVVEVTLLVRYTRAGIAGAVPELAAHHDDEHAERTDDVLAFAY